MTLWTSWNRPNICGFLSALDDTQGRTILVSSPSSYLFIFFLIWVYGYGFGSGGGGCFSWILGGGSGCCAVGEAGDCCVVVGLFVLLLLLFFFWCYEIDFWIDLAFGPQYSV